MAADLKAALVALVGLGALSFAAKTLRHVDEVRTLIGPSARAVVDEMKSADMPTDKAVTAAQAAYEAEER